jgi:hypothetical protein
MRTRHLLVLAEPSRESSCGRARLSPAIGDAVVNATTPEALVYEPQPNGRLRADKKESR